MMSRQWLSLAAAKRYATHTQPHTASTHATHTHTRKNTHTHTHTPHTHSHQHRHIHTRARAHAHTHAHKHAHIHLHLHLHTHSHTCTDHAGLRNPPGHEAIRGEGQIVSAMHSRRLPVTRCEVLGIETEGLCNEAVYFVHIVSTLHTSIRGA